GVQTCALPICTPWTGRMPWTPRRPLPARERPSMIAEAVNRDSGVGSLAAVRVVLAASLALASTLAHHALLPSPLQPGNSATSAAGTSAARRAGHRGVAGDTHSQGVVPSQLPTPPCSTSQPTRT